MVYAIQSFQSSLFCSLFESPPPHEETICKYILRAQLKSRPNDHISLL